MLSSWLSVAAMGMAKRLFRRGRMSRQMSGARLFIAGLGAIIALAGGIVAGYYERFLGIGMIVVGGFLIILTITKFSDTD